MASSVLISSNPLVLRNLQEIAVVLRSSNHLFFGIHKRRRKTKTLIDFNQKPERLEPENPM